MTDSTLSPALDTCTEFDLKPTGDRADITHLLAEIKKLAKAEKVRRARIHVASGTYWLSEPLDLFVSELQELTIEAEPGASVIFSGGIRLDGFVEFEMEGGRFWKLDLKERVSEIGYFKQLFVNGVRRPRACLPKLAPETIHPEFPRLEGATGQSVEDGFYPEGDIPADNFFLPAPYRGPWHNLTDVEVVLFHFWVDERFPLESLDPNTGLAVCSRRAAFGVHEGGGVKKWARFILENVREALTEKGEWYLDRVEKCLYYLPTDEEDIKTTEFIVPQLHQLARLRGVSHENPCRNVSLSGIAFAHAEWKRIGEKTDEKTWSDSPAILADGKKAPATATQSSLQNAGAISLSHAKNCRFSNCRFEHLGGYGVEILEGCEQITIEHCTLEDLGAGGIKVMGKDGGAGVKDQTRRLTITDNTISKYGRVFQSGAGILLAHANNCHVAYNHIHHGYYTGVSVGWAWNYHPTTNHDNIIEHNHIHDLGFGWLSDMGGIYTLGRQPGTILRRNYIHDIHAHTYGAWGIYLDEGTSYVVVEENLCHGPFDEPFDIHYGRENIIRNNLFLFGRCSQFCYGKGEAHIGCNVYQNIFVTDGAPFFNAGYMMNWQKGPHLRCDLNLFWDTATKPGFVVDNNLKEGGNLLTWDQWREIGYDKMSIMEDPQLSIADGKYTLEKDSPALKIGFRPFQVEVGPRSRAS